MRRTNFYRRTAMVLLALWSLSAVTLCLAQRTLPVPPPPPAPPPSPPPAPRAEIPPKWSTQIMLGPVASATTIKLSESMLWTIWTSADQLHNYYFNMYLRSGENGMMGRTLLEIIPYSLLVFPKEMRVNGEVITTVEAYRLDKLELIGLAMHDQPTAYSVNRHPLFMLEQTSPNEPPKPGAIKGDVPLTVTTPRPLTDAEKTALTEIKTGKDVIEQPGAEGALRIVGALRAQAGCIQCHTTNKVGDVLGAFSYRLSKVPLFGN